MKYNQFAIKDNKGNYIKYGTAYSIELGFTNSLYDPHLWDSKEPAEKLANWLMEFEGFKDLSVVLI